MHIFCGLCIADWFATKRSNTCPVCRAECVRHPQRDFALRNILPAVYTGLGRETPAQEDIDPALFTRIYTMLEESRTDYFTAVELRAFWAPMVTAVREMRGVPDAPGDPGPGSVHNPIEVDVDMDEDAEGSVVGGDAGGSVVDGDGEGSDWELGSGVNSSEFGGEDETGGEVGVDGEVETDEEVEMDGEGDAQVGGATVEADGQPLYENPRGGNVIGLLDASADIINHWS